MDMKVLNKIIWWIPSKKLRGAIWEIIKNSEKAATLENRINYDSSYIAMICEKLDIEGYKSLIPPNHFYKILSIVDYAKQYNCDTFIETGTFMGDTVELCKPYFKKLYTIELSNELFEKARERFKDEKNIFTIQGDSSSMLGDILYKINTRCLFWLDGHYSGGITACGDKETPIMEEIKIILEHNIKDHIILIDDARCFGKDKDYPTIEELEKYIKKFRDNFSFEVRNDIIRIVL